MTVVEERKTERRAEDNYSKRELDSFMKAQGEAHGEIIGQLNKILEQTTAHNGRMTKLELWKATATGAYWASSIFMAVIVIPILSWAVWTLVHLPETIQQSVDEAITSYKIETSE